MNCVSQRRQPSRAYVWALLVGALAVVLALPFLVYVRKRSLQMQCLGRLQRLVRASRMYEQSLSGFPFASSAEVIQAMIDANVIDPADAISPRTLKPLVLLHPGGGPSDAETPTVVALESVAEGARDVCLVFSDGHGECVPVAQRERLLEGHRSDAGR